MNLRHFIPIVITKFLSSAFLFKCLKKKIQRNILSKFALAHFISIEEKCRSNERILFLQRDGMRKISIQLLTTTAILSSLISIIQG